MPELKNRILQVAVTPAEADEIAGHALQQSRSVSAMARIMLLKGLSRVESEVRFRSKRKFAAAGYNPAKPDDGPREAKRRARV